MTGLFLRHPTGFSVDLLKFTGCHFLGVINATEANVSGCIEMSQVSISMLKCRDDPVGKWDESICNFATNFQAFYYRWILVTDCPGHIWKRNCHLKFELLDFTERTPVMNTCTSESGIWFPSLVWWAARSVSVGPVSSTGISGLFQIYFGRTTRRGWSISGTSSPTLPISLLDKRLQSLL